MPDSLSADDRFGILDALQRYVVAVDSGEWELFDRAFTPDATLDYRAAGGPCGSRDQIRSWLRESRSRLLAWQHHLSPPIVECAGGVVRARTDVYTPNLHRDASGEVQVLHTGGRYWDELVETEAGWRIRSRRFEVTWAQGPGSGSMIPDPTDSAPTG